MKLSFYMAVVVILLNHGFTRPTTSASDTEIRYHQGLVEVIGLSSQVLRENHLTPQQWRRIFPIYTGTSIPEPGTKSPILGTYQLTSTSIQFKPQFPLVRGMTYCAQFNLPDSLSKDQPLTKTFTLPATSTPPTTSIKHIYPSTDVLPENLLKFYIHFSAPMSRGNVYQHIYLLDASGQKVAIPFLELEPELWDPGSQRLTLFFDPGRIKRGLRPHEDLGLALSAGQTYQLVIDRDLEDANGLPLTELFSKPFTVTAADRTSPNYKVWRITSPKSGTREPVTIHIDEPLDHALLYDLFEVTDPNHQPVSGQIEAYKNETQWQFTPDQSWEQGTFHIRIQTILEDLAGNHLNRLFDADMLTQNPGDIQNKKDVTLPFEIAH